MSSSDASFIRFTLLNSFKRAVLVFSPMPLMLSNADATCLLLRFVAMKTNRKAVYFILYLCQQPEQGSVLFDPDSLRRKPE